MYSKLQYNANIINYNFFILFSLYFCTTCFYGFVRDEKRSLFTGSTVVSTGSSRSSIKSLSLLLIVDDISSALGRYKELLASSFLDLNLKETCK